MTASTPPTAVHRAAAARPLAVVLALLTLCAGLTGLARPAAAEPGTAPLQPKTPPADRAIATFSGDQA